MRPGALSIRAERTSDDESRSDVDRRPSRGIALVGRFEPSAEAMLVSPAAIFRHATPATARFSRAEANASGGLPRPPELRLRLASRDGDREVRARCGVAGVRDDGPEPPVSYATARYDGPDTYLLGSPSSDPVLLRFHFAPNAGEHRFGAGAARGLAADHLEREMLERIALRPVLFTWTAEVVRSPDDPERSISDPPAGHARILLGIVRLERLLAGEWPDAGQLDPPDNLTVVTSNPSGHYHAAPSIPGDRACHASTTSPS